MPCSERCRSATSSRPSTCMRCDRSPPAMAWAMRRASTSGRQMEFMFSSLGKQLVGLGELRHGLGAHAVGDGGAVVAAGLQLARDACELAAVSVEPLHDVGGQLVVLVLSAILEAGSHFLGAVQALQPGRMRLLHAFGLLILDDHVLLVLADVAHLAAQLGHGAHFREGVADELLAHRVDAEHAQHARTAQQAQQTQYDADGPQHANPDGEPAHERIEFHDCLPLIPPARRCERAMNETKRSKAITERNRSNCNSQRRQRFNNKAFASTLTELSAMAAPATTGLR
ncbi:hypothetical protein COLO4_01625 [Corchorus olitorius]|uniref:Uncharacterized protein n=1 Tax=Corchorus olitorius TaxID=93759 RepID=A0A1R3L2F4_9ROSI|nr:hypothetical protein COLO4_01625 [Corchorus olitorius]